MIAYMKQVVTHIKADPKSWAVETTTMLGMAIIAGSVWLVIIGKLSMDQASGLVIIGTGLLYPQSPDKQLQTQKAVITGMGVLQTILATHKSPAAPDPTESKDKTS